MNTASRWFVHAMATSGYELDYSVESAKEIERFINDNTENGNSKKDGLFSDRIGQKIFAIGSYIALTLYRNYEWQIETDDSDREGELNIKCTKDGVEIFPVQKVISRIKNGEEDNLYAYLKLVNVNPVNKILSAYENQITASSTIKHTLDVFINDFRNPLVNFDRQKDSDMILFQYGVYDWDGMKNLEFDFVRQLCISESMDDDDIVQIHITLKFHYIKEYDEIKSFSCWKNADESLENWKKTILSDKIVSIFADKKPDIYEIFKESV